MLIGLHLLGAFDTVDRSILLERLQSEFGMIGTHSTGSDLTSLARYSSPKWINISLQLLTYLSTFLSGLYWDLAVRCLLLSDCPRHNEPRCALPPVLR